MNERRMKKLEKRDKQRRIAEGIGAGFGAITSLAVLSLIFPEAREEIVKKLDKK